MDPTILGAVITAIATVLATLIGVFATPKVVGSRHRSRHHIPDVRGNWSASWFVGDDLYEEDTVKISRWKGRNRFLGTGRSAKGSYSLSGQIDSARIAVGTYQDDEYPTKGLVGTYVLELSADGKKFTGFWNGLTADGKLQSGKTVWNKVA